MPNNPNLNLPGAVAAEGLASGVPAHFGNFNAEQRSLLQSGYVDLSFREVFQISGPERLSWLNSLTSQDFTNVQPGNQIRALILSPQGHIEHYFIGSDDGEIFTAHVDAGERAELLAWLHRMIFMTQVQLAETDEKVIWSPKTGYSVLPAAEFAAAPPPTAGTWSYHALRIAAGEPNLAMDLDQRTLPNEAGFVQAEFNAVALTKGCYRGQETVARVHNLGHPPRRLTRLLLDGSVDRLPEIGDEIYAGDNCVGKIGSTARHYELGPIGLALLKRNVAITSELVVAGIPAMQEIIVDPEVGLHIKPEISGRRLL